MKSEEDINRHTDAALNSLEGLLPLEASHFMHARVMHRLQRLEQGRKAFSVSLLRTAFVLLLLAVINVAAFTLLNRNTKSQPADINGFAGAYGLQQEGYSY